MVWRVGWWNTLMMFDKIWVWSVPASRRLHLAPCVPPLYLSATPPVSRASTSLVSMKQIGYCIKPVGW
jgi:hypothetical protein